MIHRLSTNCRQKIISFVGEAAHRRSHKCSNFSESRRIVRKCYIHTGKVFWLCTWMIHRLPTNCRQKLFYLLARLHTDGIINVVISLNRTELFESVVFLHRQSILTMHMNDSQTADELPTKTISYVVEAAHRRSRKWSNSSELAQNYA